jgi:hypothetical protein
MIQYFVLLKQDQNYSLFFQHLPYHSYSKPVSGLGCSSLEQNAHGALAWWVSSQGSSEAPDAQARGRACCISCYKAHQEISLCSQSEKLHVTF